MTYDPELPTIRDQIRADIGDTAGVPEMEYLPDSTYDAYLSLDDDWRIGAIRIANAVLNRIEQDDPKSFSETGEQSVTFRDVTGIKLAIQRWQSEIVANKENDRVGKVVVVSMPYLSGPERIDELDG